jgi:thioredoxin-like negative regulator of GroEL
LKRTALLAAFALLVAPQMYAAGGFLKSATAAQKIAKEKNQLIFVDLFAEWCGWCHRFEQEVVPSQAFQEATEKMVLLRLDTEDRGEGSRLAQQFKINSLPTFLVLTPDLTIAGVMKGYAPPAEFAKNLTTTVAKHNEFLAKVKNEKTLKKPEERLALAREFISRNDYGQAELRLKKLMADKAIPATVRDGAYYDLALSYILQKKYNESMQTARSLTMISKTGEPVERAWLLMAQIHMDQGNLAGARDTFKKFKQLFPTSPLNRNVDMVLPDLERRLNIPPAGAK